MVPCESTFPPFSPPPPPCSFTQALDGCTMVNVRNDYGVGMGLGEGLGYIFSFAEWSGPTEDWQKERPAPRARPQAAA